MIPTKHRTGTMKIVGVTDIKSQQALINNIETSIYFLQHHTKHANNAAIIKNTIPINTKLDAVSGSEKLEFTYGRHMKISPSKAKKEIVA